MSACQWFCSHLPRLLRGTATYLVVVDVVVVLFVFVLVIVCAVVLIFVLLWHTDVIKSSASCIYQAMKHADLGALTWLDCPGLAFTLVEGRWLFVFGDFLVEVGMVAELR